METAVLFDTHAHLDDRKFDGDLQEVIVRAAESGIGRIITVGTNVESSEKAIGIASRCEGIFASVGFHPHDAGKFGDAEFEKLSELSLRPKVVAIGETGLDFYRYNSPRKDQISAFRRQIELAVERDLPVIVHNRKGFDDCFRLLNEFGGKARGVAHCFSGNVRDAEKFVELGFYVSFSGTVTFPPADRTTDVIRAVTGDRLLIETDCPYLAPAPVRGKRNEPAFVRFTAEVLAKARRTDLETLANLTTENATRLFF